MPEDLPDLKGQVVPDQAVPEKQLCLWCKRRKIPGGECSTSKAAAWLGLCAYCYKDPEANAARRKIVGYKPRADGRGRKGHDTAPPPGPTPAGGEATVCVNCGDELPKLVSSMARSVRWLGLCWKCYKVKKLVHARRAVVGKMPRKQSPGEVAGGAFTDLDRNLRELDVTITEMETSAREAAAESGELIERARRFGHDLKDRVGAARALLGRLDANVRESNGELRRQAKALGQVRTTMASATRAMPAVDHGGPDKKEAAS